MKNLRSSEMYPEVYSPRDNEVFYLGNDFTATFPEVIPCSNPPILPPEIICEIIKEAMQMMLWPQVPEWVQNIRTLSRNIYKILSQEPFCRFYREYRLWSSMMRENSIKFISYEICIPETALTNWDGYGRWTGMFSVPLLDRFSRIPMGSPLYRELQQYFFPFFEKTQPLIEDRESDPARNISTHSFTHTQRFFIQKVPFQIKNDPSQFEISDPEYEIYREDLESYLVALRLASKENEVIDPTLEPVLSLDPHEISNAKKVKIENEQYLENEVDDDDDDDDDRYDRLINIDDSVPTKFWKAMMISGRGEERFYTDFSLLNHHLGKNGPHLQTVYTQLFDSIFPRKFLYYTPNTGGEWHAFYFLIGETPNFYMGLHFFGERDS